MRSSTAKQTLAWAVQVFTVLAATLIVFGMLQTFVGRIYVIPSQSMEPTLHGCSNCDNDKIYVDKTYPYFHDPKPGDVVVFAGTPSWNVGFSEPRSDNEFVADLQDVGAFFGLVVPRDNTLVKRVIATQGQTVLCLPGDPSIMVNGKPTRTDYILNPPAQDVASDTGSAQCGGRYFGPITVPKDTVFVLGDNRTNSSDSRYHLSDPYVGAIPVDHIIGKATAIIYPTERISLIPKVDIV